VASGPSVTLVHSYRTTMRHTIKENYFKD